MELMTLPPELSHLSVEQTVRRLRWINISGTQKAGKTTFLAELQKQGFRIAHLDLEDGTGSLEGGRYLKPASLDEFRKLSLYLAQNKDHLNLDIVAVDTMDVLYDWFQQEYLLDNRLLSLSEEKYGKGWHEVRKSLMKSVRYLKQAAPLLITITHMKLTVLQDNNKVITYEDMDLMGQTKTEVLYKADALLVFRTIRMEDGSIVLTVRTDQSSPNSISFAGARDDRLYQVRTGPELIAYLSRMLGREYRKAG